MIYFLCLDFGRRYDCLRRKQFIVLKFNTKVFVWLSKVNLIVEVNPVIYYVSCVFFRKRSIWRYNFI